MKFIPAGASGGAETPGDRSIMSELHALTRIDHPDIVRLLEWFHEQDQYILVFQLCSGGDLLEFILEQEALTPESRITELEVGRKARHMLRALRGCHARNVIHMDVKPENFVFVDKRPDAPLKMIDLGLSMLDQGDEPNTEVGGTSRYMSPEAMREDPYDGRADVWGVGCIVFNLLLWEPFVTEREVYARKNTLRKRLQELRAQHRLSPEAQDFLEKTLSFDPVRRLTAAEALNHPFVQRGLNAKHCSADVLESAAEDAFERIGSFVQMPALRRLAYSLIARFVPDNDITESKNLFRHVDSDGDGLITHGEFAQFLEGSLEVDPQQSLELLQRLDECYGNVADGGVLHFEQFLAATLSPEIYLRSQHVLMAWQAINLGGRASVGVQDLLKLMPSRPFPEMQSLVAEVAGDDGNSITFEDFERIVRQCSLMELTGTKLFRSQSLRVDHQVASVIDEKSVKDAVINAVGDCKFCVSIADPMQESFPLIAVSREFERMTGFSGEEVLGTNCRFLNRDCVMEPSDLEGLRAACRTGAPFTAVLQNRKKSGELFLNLLDLRGIVVAQDTRTGRELWFLVGIQADVTNVLSSRVPENHLPKLREMAGLIRTEIIDNLSLLAVSGALQSSRGALGQSGAGLSDWHLLSAPRLKL